MTIEWEFPLDGLYSALPAHSNGEVSLALHQHGFRQGEVFLDPAQYNDIAL